jgi:hypothetical protein
MNQPMNQLQPQQLTFFQFCEHARIELLTNHGRAAEVFFLDESLGFVDDTGIAGLMQAHRREVNNALYARSPDAPEHFAAVELPSAAALAEYPALREKFPQACAHVDAAIATPAAKHDVSLRALATQALLVELRERGTLMPLHHAVGALYDHLERTGHLDADSPLLPFRVFRLRRFDAAVSGVSDAEASAQYWEERVEALDAGA